MGVLQAPSSQICSWKEEQCSRSFVLFCPTLLSLSGYRSNRGLVSGEHNNRYFRKAMYGFDFGTGTWFPPVRGDWLPYSSVRGLDRPP